MKIIFTSLNIRTALLLRVACGVRIVNKAFEMEMGGPSEDPSCPCAVPRHFFCTSGRYVSARTRYQARTSVLSMQYVEILEGIRAVAGVPVLFDALRQVRAHLVAPKT